MLVENDLMLLRKILWGWRPYRLLSTVLHVKYEELNKECRKIEKIMADIEDIKNLQRRETRRIKEGVPHRYGWGPVSNEKVKLPWFPLRVEATEVTDHSYEKLLAAFKGKAGSGMAGDLASIAGLDIVEVNGRNTHGRRTVETEDVELCGEKSYEIRPESRNQQRKRGQQQDNQQS